MVGIWPIQHQCSMTPKGPSPTLVCTTWCACFGNLGKRTFQQALLGPSHETSQWVDQFRLDRWGFRSVLFGYRRVRNGWSGEMNTVGGLGNYSLGIGAKIWSWASLGYNVQQALVPITIYWTLSFIDWTQSSVNPNLFEPKPMQDQETTTWCKTGQDLPTMGGGEKAADVLRD